MSPSSCKRPRRLFKPLSRRKSANRRGPGQYQLLGQFVRAIEADGDVIIAGAQLGSDEFVDFGFRRRPAAVAVFDLDDDGEDSNSMTTSPA